MVKTVSSLRDLRVVMESWRRRDETVGFVPTLGALHDGHTALIRQAQSLSTRVVSSIFVNPLEFEDPTELENFPRPIEEDERILTHLGCDLLFLPSVDTMYPQGFSTMIEPGPLANVLEGRTRSGHFIGVSTVMVKLLMQVMPDYVFISERDFQQLRVIEQVVKDLHIPVGVIPVPTVRDIDEVTWSTQNAQLSKEERMIAAILPQVLRNGVEDIHAGHNIEATLAGARQQLEDAGAKVDYFELVDSRTLSPAHDLRKPTRLIAAIIVGKTRLIDNMAV